VTDVSLDALRNVQRLISRLNTGADLAATLRAVVDGVVEGLGFGVAVVNLVHDDGSVEVVTVAGPQEVSDTLLGTRSPLASWEATLERSHRWGGLRYQPQGQTDEDDLPSWVPDGRELLEMYGTQAGIAIDNARLAERLKASEEAFRLAFDNAPTGMTIVDLAPATVGLFLRVNEAMCRTLGYSRRGLLGRGMADITHPDNRESDVDLIRDAVDRGASGYQAEQRYLRADGQPLWMSVHCSVVRDSGGTALYGIAQFEDISDRRAEHQELTRRALVDSLTGLHNRTSLTERVESAITVARRTGREGALLFCDLDAFKPVNDSYGHGVGDQVLTIIARRLEAQVRTRDTTARFGGDEFVVVAEDLGGDDLADLVGRLRDAVAAPIDVAGVIVALSITVGSVSVTGALDETPDGLIAAADMDMYLRKPGAAPV